MDTTALQLGSASFVADPTVLTAPIPDPLSLIVKKIDERSKIFVFLQNFSIINKPVPARQFLLPMTLIIQDNERTMLERSQSRTPRNESMSANSSTSNMALPITSGGVGRDVECQGGAVENKERPSPDNPPEGGFQAWTVVLGAWCCSFCCYGWINSEHSTWSSAIFFRSPTDCSVTNKGIGVFQAYYETHQLKNYSSSTISWITSLEIFFMLFMARPSFLPPLRRRRN